MPLYPIRVISNKLIYGKYKVFIVLYFATLLDLNIVLGTEWQIQFVNNKTQFIKNHPLIHFPSYTGDITKCLLKNATWIIFLKFLKCMFSNVLVLLILLNGAIYEALGCEQILCSRLPQQVTMHFTSSLQIAIFVWNLWARFSSIDMDGNADLTSNINIRTKSPRTANHCRGKHME